MVLPHKISRRLYPNNFESKIEFTSIRNLLKSYCLSTLGKIKVEKMNFSTDFNFINNLLKQTSEFKEIIENQEDFPVDYYFDTSENIKKAEKKGSFLLPEELFDIKRSLETINDILNFFKNDIDNNYPELKKLASEIELPRQIIKTINSAIDKYGRIKDNASPELRSIRQNLRSKQSGVSSRISKIIQKAKQAGFVEDDTEAVIRGGKMLIPVPASNKRKINGYVFDESDTGKTSYIEPLEIIEINNQIKELEFAQRREIIRILTGICDIIREYIPQLNYSYDFLGTIDFIRAKSRLAINTNAEKPTLINSPSLDFRMAAHSLLYLAYKSANKKVVRSDIEINDKTNIILISGPNAGGKSVTLKTACLLQYMVQCGLLISTYKNSKAGIFNKFFIDIGDEQSIENDLSTYSSHLVNMKFFSENSDKKTFICIDEFGTGTEPNLGGAIAEAFLEVFVKNKAKGIITTHYSNLKDFAANNENITNAAMLYDPEKMMPLYKLEVGKPGSSFAFEIAKKTGINEKILKSAERKIDENQINFEKLLKENIKDKRNLRQKRRGTKLLEQKLQETVNKYETTLNKVLAEKKLIIKKAHEQAEQILASANSKIENTIHDIKLAQAEKEKTKTIRADLENFRKEEEKNRQEEQQKIDDRIRKIKERQEKRKNKENIPTTEIKKEKIIPVIGDIVRISGQKTAGKLTKIKGKNATVEFVGISMKVKFETLETVNKKEAQKYNKSRSGGINIITESSKSKNGFVFGLDVRGKRADDALSTVTGYIDDAIVADASEVKILHGTGTGALQQIIREYLKSVPAVQSARDERIEAGGAGITVVKFR